MNAANENIIICFSLAVDSTEYEKRCANATNGIIRKRIYVVVVVILSVRIPAAFLATVFRPSPLIPERRNDPDGNAGPRRDRETLGFRVNRFSTEQMMSTHTHTNRSSASRERTPDRDRVHGRWPLVPGDKGRNARNGTRRTNSKNEKRTRRVTQQRRTGTARACKGSLTRARKNTFCRSRARVRR